jgi:hypothetical protein
VESLTETLMQRVGKLVPPRRKREWGNPLVSTTPASLAIRELAIRVEALEEALREIALEVQSLSGQTTSRAEPRESKSASDSG